jgi:hypothetical protein
MQVYAATAKGPLKMPGYIDPNDTTIITVFWGAPAYDNDTVYRVGDIVRPPTDNGYYYECTTAGVTTHSSENHAWPTDEHQCGTAVFAAKPYDLWVLPHEFLQADGLIPASVWTATAGVTLSSPLNDSVTSSVVIEPLPEGVTEFELTNQARKSNGERLSRTFKYKVHEQ